MPHSYFWGQTLDDTMRILIEEIQSNGELIAPTKGECRELTGVMFEIDDPTSRLSRTETRGKPFSCLGELCWYLAGSNSLDFIKYYIGAYGNEANKDKILGGYGPRLFNWDGINQIDTVIEILKTKRDSRQAVIQLFDSHDLNPPHRSIPCTCTLQFMIRNNRLYMLTSMRSNDIYVGLPHDVFTFTMLQEIVARSLCVELGSYKHVVGSLHLYSDNNYEAQCFLAEGWQSTQFPMPPMPAGDPWPSLQTLVKAEANIRLKTGWIDVIDLNRVDPYWADLIRLLQIFRFLKDHDFDKIEKVRDQMASSIYVPFINKKIDRN